MNNWKLAQKVQASGRRGMIIGMCMAILIIVAVVLTIVKINWLKKCLCCDCDCDLDDYDDDFYLDTDDLDENGCAYTSEKDFV